MMEWITYLLILLCPIMMIFMMKGHGKGHQNHNNSHVDHELEKKINHLHEDNKKLRDEVENLSVMVKKDS